MNNRQKADLEDAIATQLRAIAPNNLDLAALAERMADAAAAVYGAAKDAEAFATA